MPDHDGLTLIQQDRQSDAALAADVKTLAGAVNTDTPQSL